MSVIRYIASRVLVYVATILIGVTIVFIIPRLTGTDPVVSILTKLTVYGEYYDPEVYEQMLNSLRELYGLKGSIMEQYVAFMRRLFIGDFGPSIIAFPTPAMDIVHDALPWTLGLLSMSLLISWILGNLVGGIAGYFSNSRWSSFLTVLMMSTYAIPYYITALLLVVLFTYLIPLFPLMGGAPIGVEPSLSMEYILDLVKHAFLPAMSIVLMFVGWWFISMRSMSIAVKSDDYVRYAELMNLPKRLIMWKYVVRNALLPQVTGLSIQLGLIFSGTLVSEVVFAYPGIGYILYQAVINNDFNLIMASTIYSIIAVATSVLIIDLIYPLVDPRIRYR
mgnify:CR=1 FL=1